MLQNLKIKRSIRFFFQRMFRGWDDSETFSLDYSLAKLILPRLRRFQQLRMGHHPVDLTEVEWENIIAEMISAFEFLSSEERWVNTDPEQEDHAQHGVELFAKWYPNLWW